jgi:ABC-2 type transport system ATP-binding protein
VSVATAAGPASAGEPVLGVAGLERRYGETLAVQAVSFVVRTGEIVGLLGPNGAGKTTTINMILGVLEPSGGSINIAGLDVRRDRSRALAKANFSAVYAALPGNLTVCENLRVFGLIYCVSDLDARIASLLATFDLAPLRDTKCGLLSSGEQTRVNLAKALLNRPALLLLDEPTASLDPSTAQTVRAQIQALTRSTGCGVLWTSHNMQEVETVCDRVLFLSRGRILLEGRPGELPAQHGTRNLEELFIRVAREPLAPDFGATG